MTYSFIIAALICGIAAFFGMAQKKRLTNLETQWVLLSEKAVGYGVPTDREEDFAAGRLSHRSSSEVRTADVDSLAHRIVELMREIEDAQEDPSANQLALEQRGMRVLEEFSDLSGPEMKLLIEKVLADTSIENSLKREVIMTSIMMLSEKDPEASLALILKTKSSLLRGSGSSKHMIGMVVAQFAKRNPQGAVDWLKAHEGEIGKIDDDLRAQVLAEAGGDLQQAASIISELGFEHEGRAFQVMAQRVTLENIAEFLKIVREGDDFRVTQSALVGLSQSPFSKDVEKATAFLEEEKLTAKEQKEFFNGLNYYDQKENAKEWLNWMVERRSLDPAISRQLLQGWARDDFGAAGEWVNTLEKGSQRDQAVGTYARTLAEHEPAGAAIWVESLPEGAKRDRLRSDIYRLWHKKNPVAASAYAKEHGVAQ